MDNERLNSVIQMAEAHCIMFKTNFKSYMLPSKRLRIDLNMTST